MDFFFFEQITMDFKINLGREVFQFPALKNAKATLHAGNRLGNGESLPFACLVNQT